MSSRTTRSTQSTQSASRHVAARLATALLLALPMLAHAQSADADAATTLDTLIVTATRSPTPLQRVLLPVEVIDRAAIRDSQALSLNDLLRDRAGIQLTNQGGLGKLTSLFLRGTESDHVLVLVDGVRVGSVSAGPAALQDLPLAQIERIEIVRGPLSSLYGADAIGGVIQIFTRGGHGGRRIHASVGAGSHGLWQGDAGIGFGDASAWLDLNLAHQQTDGINACRGSSTAFAGCFTEEPDRDGYRNTSVSLRGGWRPSDALALDASLLRAEGRNEYDASAAYGLPNVSDVTQQVAGVHARWQATGGLALSARLGSNVDDSHDFRDGTELSHTDSRRDSASLLGEFTPSNAQRISVGFDAQREHLASSAGYTVNQRWNRGLFAEYQGDLGPLLVQLAARHDDNQQFGGHSTGSLALGHRFAHGLRIALNAGTAFKAPTFNELYYPFFGNPALKPETARNLGLNLGLAAGGWDWSLDLFQNRVRDLIAYDASLFLPNNIDGARIRGGELTANGTLAGWRVHGTASVADAVSTRGAYAGKRLPRRARDTARLDLDRGFGAWQLGATWRAEGARYDDLANTRRLGGNATFDLRATYAFHRDWQVLARLANVFDKRYETVAFYNQPGREWQLTLRYAPRD
jgi:vitamin B12 transporter